MTSIDFSLNLALYGAISIFVILSLIILYTETLKRVLMRSIPTKDDQIEKSLLSDEEVAAITAAVTIYMETEAEPNRRIEYEVPASRWSQTGRIEEINRRMRD